MDEDLTKLTDWEVTLRLEFLSGEVRRLKRLLESSSTLPHPSGAPSSVLVRDLLDAHRERQRLFGDELFSDPAWEMLTEAYALELEGGRATTNGLSTASGVPDSTAARWLRKLEECGLLERRQDPRDGRRNWVLLSVRARNAMDLHFRALTEAFLSSIDAPMTRSRR